SEVGEVPARLRLLRPEGRPEAVDRPERLAGRLEIELARLREVRFLAEVVRLEERGRPLAGRRREDGGIDQDEPLLVEEITAGLDDLVADAERRVGPGGTQPQMPMIEQEVDSMLLRLDRIRIRLGDEVDDLGSR